MLQRAFALLTALLLVSGFWLPGVLRAADDGAVPPPPPPKQPARPLAIARAAKPLKAPAGDAQGGWELFLKNDCAGAEAAFREALKNNPQDLVLLEGLRAAVVFRGDYQAAQKINLQMVEYAADTALANVFAGRAVDALPFVESRAALRETFSRVAASACPAVAANLKDHLATLCYQTNRPDEARKLLEDLGYVDKWLFVAGPFGSKDRNNTIEKRFAPERALKSLDFTDPDVAQFAKLRDGEKIEVHKDQKLPNRDLNLDTLYPGAKGVFYAFTNLESDSDQDVILGVSAAASYRAYLRGMPILQEPEEEQFRRTGGELVRTRLVQGPNPLLLKLSAPVSLTVRLLAADYGPAKGVRVKALAGGAMAEHAVLPVRGVLFSQKVAGSTAAYFLKRFAVGGTLSPAAGLRVPPAAAAKPAGENEELRALADGGALTVAEAIWLDTALQRESAVAARGVLARRLAGSFPDSAGVLDHAAGILQSAGVAMGASEGRDAEEARQWREHALRNVPTSHQHLLALCHFFIEHDLVDQAFENIKACVAAHPDSPLAQAELGAVYQRKQFYVEAEKCLEKAAALDEAYLPRLIGFHEAFGNRVRARELRQKLVERGQLSLEAQFDMALRRGDLTAAEKNLEQQEKLYPERKDELAAQKVRFLEEKGDLKEAYKLQRKLYDAQPRYHAYRRATLSALVDLAVRLGKDDDAQTLLRAYLKDHAGDVEFSQRLSELQGQALPHWWEPYDVKVAAIDTSRFDNQRYPTANHAWIVDFMVTRVLPDLSSDSYVHIAQKVLNLQGINELSELLVRAQRQDLLFVRTLNPDGSVYEPQNMHGFNLAQSASLYKVGPGSILEHAYVMRTAADEDEPSFTMGFNFNAIDAPRAVSRWVVMIPDDVKARLDIRKIRPEMVDEKILPGPPGCTVYQWTNTQVEGIKAETLMPTENDQEVIPLVLVESKNLPYRANAWLMRREKHDIPPEAVEQARRIVVEGLLKNPDDASRFDALVLWVWRNIQPGDDSRTLTDVWFARAGRPDQMTELALAMAQSVGLKVRLAHLNGAYAPGRVFKPRTAKRLWEPMELANFGSAGRMLVLEQDSGPDRWVEFGGRSPKYSWPMDLNRSQAGAVALTLGDDGARLKRVHGEELGLSPSLHRVQVALDDRGTGSVQGTLLMFGHAGGAWREALADPRRQTQAREWVVRHAWPKGEIGAIKVSGEAPSQFPLAFTYACVVKELAAQAGDAFFLSPFLNKPRLLELRGPAERQNDMLLKEEWADLDHTVTYVAPAGHGWVEVPDDLFVCTEFGFYLVDFNVQGRTLTCTRSYLLPMQRVTPEQYRRLLDFLQQVSDSQQRIAYGPLKSTSFGPYRREVYSMGYAGCGQIRKEK